MIRDILDKNEDLRRFLFIRGFLITTRKNYDLNDFPFYPVYLNKLPKKSKKSTAYPKLSLGYAHFMRYNETYVQGTRHLKYKYKCPYYHRRPFYYIPILSRFNVP